MNEIEIEETKAPADAGGQTTSETTASADAGTVSAAQLNDLKKRAAKADEHWDRLLRTLADFDNYKKRAAREKQDTAKFANEALLQRLIPVLDSFDMALTAAAQTSQPQALESMQAGINMVYQQLKAALAEAGLEDVEAQGKTFDPNLHEAISQRETTEAAEGQVVQQLRKGYRFRERLLRPATVIIAKHPAA